MALVTPLPHGFNLVAKAHLYGDAPIHWTRLVAMSSRFNRPVCAFAAFYFAAGFASSTFNLSIASPNFVQSPCSIAFWAS